MTQSLSLSRILKGLAVALGSFVALGTVAALWENPLFVRMTPAGDPEVVLLGLLSVLLGTYVAVRRPFCSVKTVGVGGVLGFIGVACPVCNQVLLLLFGGDLLLTYFEPVRIYVAGVGVLVVAAAVAREWLLVKRQPAPVAALAAPGSDGSAAKV
ncbi:MAG: hypothetical protein O7A64_11580 [Alphaproteobacteria bacterium]|nr:hypothetical protein [Alphaproteobacteria bacterium]